MAKMKRMRQKLHNAAAKARDQAKQQSATEKQTSGDQPMEDAQFKLPLDPTSLGARGDNLFKDVKINPIDLTPQKLPDFDARSTLTSKTFKGQNLTKKEKMKIRKDVWMAKMDSISAAKKKAKERKKKQQTPIVGDLTQMEEALPTLELLMKKSNKPTEKKDHEEKNRPIPREKKRKRQMNKDINLFHRVWQHPQFKSDAGATIKTHLKNKLMVEKEMET